MMRSTVLLSMAVLICGCAAPPPQPYSREVRRPERVVPLGIVHTERTTDVVTMLESVEYALFPSVPVSGAPAVQAPALPLPAASRENTPRPKIDYAPLLQSTMLIPKAQQCESSK